MTDSFTFTGRTLKPWYKKINPIWWFQNDDEQDVPEWYHPDWPMLRRQLMWDIRNPLRNFLCYVAGVQDRNYTVTGKAPVLTVQRNDLMPPETGFQWSVIWLPIPAPFVSYSGKRIVWYLGWQPTGGFGVKFNISG